MSTEVAQLQAQAVIYRDYPQDRKAEALAVWEAHNKSSSLASQILGIPRQTLDYWIKQEGRYAEIQQEKRGILADRLENIAYNLADSIDDHDLSVVPLQAKATTMAIAIDKMQLLRGQPTSIVQTESVTSNNVLVMLCEALGETIDVTPTSE